MRLHTEDKYFHLTLKGWFFLLGIAKSDGRLIMDVLKRLARTAVKYGLKPESIGPLTALTDGDYLARYLEFTRTWDSRPAKPKAQLCARKEWDRLLARMKPARMTERQATRHPATAKRTAPRRKDPPEPTAAGRED